MTTQHPQEANMRQRKQRAKHTSGWFAVRAAIVLALIALSYAPDHLLGIVAVITPLFTDKLMALVAQWP